MKSRIGLNLARVRPLSVIQAGVLAVSALFGTSMASAQEQDRFRGLIEPIKAEKPLTFGVTLVHLNDDFWKGIAYGIQDEARRSGAKVVQISVAGNYGNVREQFGQLSALKSLGVDYAFVGAASFDGYNNIFKDLQSSGTKVVAVGIPVNSANVTFGVGQDESAIGAALADAICKVKPDSLTVSVPGPAGAEWARLRYVAFTEKAKSCNGMKVLPGAFGGGVDLSWGLSQTADQLLRHPDASFVYTPVIPLGMGAVQAIKQLKRPARVVSSAVVNEAIPMIKDGSILATVSEPGILIGRLAVQYAIRQAEGKPMPNLIRNDPLPYPHILIPPTVITPENVGTYPFDLYDLPPQGWRIDAVQ